MDNQNFTILLVGSGAREHAMAKSISKSKRPFKLIVFGSSMNPGIAALADTYISGNINDPEAVADYAKSNHANLAVVGPEAPLEAGVADKLWSLGIPVVGPKMQLAMLETSKQFTRNLMADYDVPGCPKFKYFSDLDGAGDFLGTLMDNYVVKADGLMGGKGVKVAGDHLHSHNEALEYCQELCDAGSTYVIEEKCIGEEFSLFSFCDGTTLKHMPPIQDHKRAYVDDKGPNTGGMGSYSDANHRLPFITQTDIEEAQEINRLVVEALRKKTGEGYKGILYGGYMATAKGVKVIEFNARFGDPEVMNLLTLLDTDIIDIFEAICSETLDQLDVSFKKLASVCKYVVPTGYPDNPEKGFEVDLSQFEKPHQLFLGAVDQKENKLVATGSRTAAVVGVAPTIEEAEQEAERLVNQIKGDLFHRPDIGTIELIEKRVTHMKALRG
ncbi:MAG: phosphoribosylamine--glycine ligase [Verrucomicrobia bacterium]|nr:phosphoribosylamine--glycine ligase [Verrucomicrobiota bacterium]MDA1065667.1 phosphoribosylamine--glycine ligase [Verrucomicrobiota bacterium]